MTVLFVEDFESLREFGRRVLERDGHVVHVADDAFVALRVFIDHPVDVLVTDIFLPGGPTGTELAAQLLEKRPALRVVYMSGAGEDEAPVHDGAAFVGKPFSGDMLCRAVRAASHDPAAATESRSR